MPKTLSRADNEPADILRYPIDTERIVWARAVTPLIGKEARGEVRKFFGSHGHSEPSRRILHAGRYGGACRDRGLVLEKCPAWLRVVC